MKSAEQRLGSIDVIVNNAGIQYVSPICEVGQTVRIAFSSIDVNENSSGKITTT